MNQGREETKVMQVREVRNQEKKDRKHLKMQKQAILDEYGSEAYFCGSSCSECDSQNHRDSEIYELQPDFQREDSDDEEKKDA